MSHVGWRRNNHELDTRLPPVEGPVKLADFCQLAERRLNATGHWSSLLTPVVKRAATIVIPFAEIRGSYLAYRIFAHAVLPFLLHFPLWVVDAQVHWAVRQQFKSEGPLVQFPSLEPSEQLVQREMKRCLLLRLRWTALWLGNNGSHGTVRCSTSFRYSHSFVKTGPIHHYYSPEVLQSAKGNRVQRGI